MRAQLGTLLCGALLTSLTACGSQGSPARPAGSSAGDGAVGSADPSREDAGADEGGALDPNGIARSSNSSLQWKRYAAFEADLSSALSLPKESLCKEFGKEDCIRGVHLSPLGGHDPFRSGLLESSAEPLATTPTVVERIVLSACSQRAELDLKAGSSGAMMFKALDLAAAAPAPDSDATQSVVTDLYRRFLARDPDPEERKVITALAVDEQGQPVGAHAFVKAACFAIGTSTEFLFF